MDAPVVLVGGVPYPPTLSTDETASWLSCSPERLQQLRGTGELPCEPIQLGRRLRWPTADLARTVGLSVEVVPADSCPIVAEVADCQVIDLPSHGPDDREAAS